MMLSLMLCQKLPLLLNELGVQFSQETQCRYAGCCPIHEGDNSTALTIYKGGQVPGKWVCRTRHCEETFKRTILGFVRGMLSRRKFGWSKAGDNTVSFPETVRWCCSFLGQELANLKVDLVALEKRGFADSVELLVEPPKNAGQGMPRNEVRKRLEIPAPYFLGRGYSPQVLDRFDVGTCLTRGKAMSNRVVVPVYDTDHQYCVGVLGRSIFEKCETCGYYHGPGSPCEPVRKWVNSEELSRDSLLYNYWSAKAHIFETGTAILVEGAPDLWRVVESGYENVVALMGTDMTDRQQILLECAGCLSVTLLLNEDEAGRMAKERIRKKLGKTYCIRQPHFDGKDLGEKPVDEVRKILGGDA
jgi:hypothetical protein